MENKFDIRFVADTNKKREKGLMFAEPLDDKEVVFFIFPSSDYLSFWNKNVDFDLSLAFLDDMGRVVDFADLEKQSEKSVGCSKPSRFVIEAKKGAFKKGGIELGDYFIYDGNQLIHVPKK